MNKKKGATFIIFLMISLILLFGIFYFSNNFDAEKDSIEIFNVQSYPAVGGNWEVNFKTIGTANLTISTINATSFGFSSPDDLKFVGLKCGSENINYEIIGDKIFIKDYQCPETSVEISNVLTSGKHILEFRFGESKNYAYNFAFINLLYSDCNTLAINSSLFGIMTTNGDSSSIFADGSNCVIDPQDTNAELTLHTQGLKENFTSFKVTASPRIDVGNGRGWSFGIGNGTLYGQTSCQSNTGWSPSNGYFVCILGGSGARLIRVSGGTEITLNTSTWLPDFSSYYNFSIILDASGVLFFVNDSLILSSSDTTYSQGYLTFSTGGGGSNRGVLYIDNLYSIEKNFEPIINILDPNSQLYGTSDIDFNILTNENVDWCGFSLDSQANISMNSANSTFFTYSYVGISDGNHNITFSCNDTYGLPNTTSILNFGVDTISPKIQLVNPKNITYDFNSIPLDYLIQELNPGFCWYSDDQGLTNYSLPGCLNSTYSSNQGLNHLIIYSNDSLGNLNSSEVFFFVDSILPQIQFTTGTEQNNSALKQDFIFLNVSVDELNEVNITFSLYNKTNLIYENTFTDLRREISWTLLSDDTYFYNVSIEDLAGNKNSTETRKIILDNQEPTIDFSTGTQEDSTNISQDFIYINTSLTEQNLANITFSLYNISGLINQTTFTTQTTEFNFTNFPDGTYFYNVTAFDIVNQNSSTLTRAINLDSTFPQISFSLGVENNFVNTTKNFIFVNVSVNETNEANITFALYSDEGIVFLDTFVNMARSINWTGLGNNHYYYNVTVFDIAGKYNSTETRKITLDNEGPVLEIVEPKTKAYGYGENLLFSHTALDDLLDVNTCWWNLDSLLNQTISCGNTAYFNTTEGIHEINLYANDSLGNFKSKSITFSVSTTGPAISLISPSDETFFPFPGVINLTYTAVDTDGIDYCFLYTNFSGSWTQQNATKNSWFSHDWKKRKIIIIPYTKVQSNLTDFPVLIDLYDSRIHDYTLANGDDILFTSPDGVTKLSYEIEYFNQNYNSTHAHLVAWVKTNLSSSQNNSIYLYYNNSLASGNEDPAGVWDLNFKLVQHLEENCATTNCILDSTSNDNHGTPQNGASIGNLFTSSGLIDGAGIFDGTDDYIECGTSSIPNTNQAMTLEAWAYYTGTPGTDNLIVVDDLSGAAVQLGFRNTAVTTWMWGGGVIVTSALPGANNWHHYVFTTNGANHILYVDGVQTATSTVALQSGTPNEVRINTNSWSENFAGTMDEVRISNINRSPQWINTSYQNQNNASSFYILGNEESLYGNSFSVNITSGGLFMWNVLCNDTLGYNSTSLSNFTFILDTEYPQIYFSEGTPDSGEYLSQNWIYTNVSIIEPNFENVTFRLYNQDSSLVDETTFSDSTREKTWNYLSEGLYFYNVTATDKASKQNFTETRNVTLDTSSPDANLIFPENNSYSKNLQKNFNATFSDNFNLKNATLYILNQTGSIIYVATQVISGTDALVGESFDFLYDGIFSWFYRVFDSAGNSKDSEIRTLTIDSLPPQIQFTIGTEQNNSALKQDFIFVNVSVEESNEVNITFSLYNKTNLISENTFTDLRREISWTLLPDDNYFYNVSVEDLAGNKNSTETRKIILDNQAPIIDFSTGTQEDSANVSQNFIYINTSLTEQNFANITFSLYNISGLINQTTFITQINEINFINLPDGNYFYNVTAFDIVNQNSSTLTRTINLDSNFPKIQFITGTLSNNTNVSQNFIYINTSLTEQNFANITFSLYNISGLINQTTYTNQTIEINFTDLNYGNKIYFYNVSVEDLAGNINSTETRKITLVDYVNPLLSIIRPENRSYSTNTSLILDYAAIDDNLENCWYNLDGGINISLEECQNSTFDVSDMSPHTLNLYANDSSGNFNFSSVSFFVNSSLIFTTDYRVERGSSSVDGSLNIPISETDESKAFVFLTSRSSDSGGDSIQVIPYFANPDTLILENYVAGAGANVEWEIITGPDIHVQRDTYVYTTAESTINIQINSVNLSSSFILINNRLSDGTAANNVRGFWTARFVNSSFIQLQRGATGSAGEVSWQVIQWDGSTVQRGNMNSATTSAVSTFSAPVNVNRSFIIFSKRISGGTALSDINIGGYLSNSTALTFYRNRNTGTMYTEWFVIQNPLLDVQRGSFTIAGSSMNVPLNSLRNLEKSFHRESHDSTGTGNTFANSVLTTAITSQTNIQSIPGTTATNSKIVNWEVIEITERIPPVINLFYPNQTNFPSHSIDKFNFTVQDNSSIINCTLYENWTGSWSKNQTIISPSKNMITNFSEIIVPSDGFYSWNVLCYDIYYNSAFASLNNSFSSFLPPEQINFTYFNSSIINGNSVLLSWNASNHSLNYKIYYSDSLNGNYTLLNETSNTTYLDNSANASRRRFYKISAWNPTQESQKSEAIGKTVYTLKRVPNLNTRNWIGFYLDSSTSDAITALSQIANITTINSWNATLQKRVTCNDFSCPEPPFCTDTNCNFEINSGYGYEVNLNSSAPLETNWTVTGKIISPVQINLIKNSSDFGKNWISLSANTSLNYAEDILNSISNSDAISKWDESLQKSSGLVPSPFPWIPYLGENFILEPEKGYEVSVIQNVNWTQE